MDTDDEVRDRAAFYYHILNKQDKQLASGYILNCRITCIYINLYREINLANKLISETNFKLFINNLF